VLQGETPMGRMPSIGAQWVYTGEYRSLEQDMASLGAVNRASLQEVLRDFPFDPMTIVRLGPE
jgi:predicted Zn-dependent peptidase